MTEQHVNGSSLAAAGNRNRGAWWGDFEFEIEAWGYWRVGPLGLWVGRRTHDWQIGYLRDNDPYSNALGHDVPADLERTPVPVEATMQRVAFAQTTGLLHVQPLLADRPVVARPDTPISIPPGERVSAFVSSAIWIGVREGKRPERMFEIPTWRSSDTWFGDNRSGFLCYSTRTTMRLDADALSPRPHRAVTPIVIDNQGHDTLNVARLSLPVPNLSAYTSPSGELWTERLHLTREDDAELARIHIDEENPPLPGAERVSGPREPAEDRLLSRVFTGLFG